MNDLEAIAEYIELLHIELQEKQRSLGLKDNDFIDLYEIVEAMRELGEQQ